MLRITVNDVPELLTFRLEGTLTGPWVREAENCWQSANRKGRAVRLDLTGVTTIDVAGKRLLTSAHAEGAALVACGCLMRAIVADITGGSHHDCGCS